MIHAVLAPTLRQVGLRGRGVSAAPGRLGWSDTGARRHSAPPVPHAFCPPSAAPGYRSGGRSRARGRGGRGPTAGRDPLPLSTAQKCRKRAASATRVRSGKGTRVQRASRPCPLAPAALPCTPPPLQWWPACRRWARCRHPPAAAGQQGRGEVGSPPSGKPSTRCSRHSGQQQQPHPVLDPMNLFACSAAHQGAHVGRGEPAGTALPAAGDEAAAGTHPPAAANCFRVTP